MGGSGKVHLTASLHRANWVAGQRCYVDVTVKNESGKRINSLILALMRTSTIYRPASGSEVKGNATDGSNNQDAEDAASYQTQTSRKKVAEVSLEMGKKAAKGNVTARGLWLGVEKDETAEFSHSLSVPVSKSNSYSRLF